LGLLRRVLQAHPSQNPTKPATTPNPATPQQGEVEQISLMRPKSEGPAGDSAPGLLEYLEDIIGTDKLVPQIEEEGKRCVVVSCVCGGG